MYSSLIDSWKGHEYRCFWFQLFLFRISEWCSPGQYICPNSRVCIERSRLCDGIKDCPLGDDEKQCINLFPIEPRPASTYLRSGMQRRTDPLQGGIILHERTDNHPKHVLQDGEDSYLQNTLYPVYHDAGFLMIQKQGQWGKLCMNQINNFIMKTLKWKISDLGMAICKSMTFRWEISLWEGFLTLYKAKKIGNYIFEQSTCDENHSRIPFIGTMTKLPGF